MAIIMDLPPPEEGIRHQQPNTRAVFNDRSLGSGTVYIAERQFSWIETATGKGFTIDYPHISLHAVSRDLDSFPEECFLVMVDHYVNFSNGVPSTNRCLQEVNGGNEEDEDDEEDENYYEDDDVTSELRFIPEDPSCLNQMYNAMAFCQSLHRDVDDILSEESSLEEEEDDNEEEEGENNDEQQGSNADMGMEVEGQFDDA